MNKQRAKELLGMVTFWGTLPQAYRAKCDVSTKTIDPNGITEEEHNFVVKYWNATMPGNTTFMDALRRIAEK